MMTKAIWNDVVLAESKTYETAERNIYFPIESISKQYFKKSETPSVCFWKGRVSYYDIEVNGKINKDAA